MIDNFSLAQLRDYLQDYLDKKHTPAGKFQYNCRCGSSDALHYHRKTNTWHCYSCGEGGKHTGDIFTLYALDHGLDRRKDFAQVVTELGAMYGVHIEQETAAKADPLPPFNTVFTPRSLPAIDSDAPAPDYSVTIADARDCLLDGKNFPAMECATYLANRGISRDTAVHFGLGAGFAPNYPNRPAIILPAQDGKTYEARLLQPAEHKKKDGTARLQRYDIPAGAERQIYVCQQDGQSQAPTWIVEGAFNAFSLWQAGGNAIALGGAQSCRDAVLQYAEEHPEQAPYILHLDADNAGNTAAKELTRALHKAGVPCITWPKRGDQRDCNDILAADETDGTQTLATMVKQARALAATDPAITMPLLEQDGARNWQDALLQVQTGRYARTYATHSPALNAMLGGGLHPGLVVLGAGTGAGKTTWVLQLAAHLAKAGTRVVYISLEMATVELYTRIISREVYEKHQRRVTAQALRLQTPQDAITGRAIGDAIAALGDAVAPNLYIREGIGDCSAREIKEIARYYAALDSQPPVIIIDYLQLLAPQDARQTDKQATDANVREIKRLSRDLGALVIAISAYNREAYTAAEPSLRAYKESGSIEYTSDIVLALQAEEQPQGSETRSVEMYCLKNRDGRKDWHIRLDYAPAFNTFADAPEQTHQTPADSLQQLRPPRQRQSKQRL